MKLKSILLTAAATISLATATMAQVPNYLPTNGLVGWWPFNGNANDESSNGNDGNNYGCILSSDRFNVINSSYVFDGMNNHIDIANPSSLNLTGSLSISAWIYLTGVVPPPPNPNTVGFSIVNKGIAGTNGGYQLDVLGNQNPGEMKIRFLYYSSASFYSETNLVENQWYFVTATNDSISGEKKIYINGVLDTAMIGVPNTNSISSSLWFGGSNTNNFQFFPGKIDDIGIWNRTLTQQEITDLYNAVNCANNTATIPQTNSLATGSTATFNATTSDPNPSFIWQSDFGQGYVELNNYGNYSGANTANLNIANVQLSEHNQPIRVITTSGNCIDTSNVALINILDTCITSVTVYDTLLTTVTDTLLINATITGLNPPNNQNTLKIFPNPTNTHITINYGNFSSMNGYTLKIVNAVGQTVFTTPINQQTSYIDLSTWTGNGIYYVQLIDTQNNTIENRKIVIQ